MEDCCVWCLCNRCDDLTCRDANCSVCPSDDTECGVDTCDHQLITEDEDDWSL